MRSNKIPSIGMLLAFEAAAESGSFTAAAAKLFITPAAISQNIRALEQHLSIALFERSKTGIKLSRAGQSYLSFISDALEKIRLAQQQLEQFRNLNVLTITTFPSVASKWLMPLVLDWMDLNPGSEIRVEASHARVDFNRSASDLCICFGRQNYAGLQKDLLFTDSVSMVLSPKLLQRIEDKTDIKAITQLPMIHIDWEDHNHNLPDWGDWLQAANVDMTIAKAGPHFNLSSMAIDAALQGKGLLLGQHILIAKELETGQLIKPLDISLPLGQAYYLVYPKRTLENPLAAAFIDWVKQQAPKSTEELN
ncbi:LysR substrate-binding domain-containing protein [Gammaproteobacteria bacterium AS21]